MGRKTDALERIAAALERIAEAIEQRPLGLAAEASPAQPDTRGLEPLSADPPLAPMPEDAPAPPQPAAPATAVEPLRVAQPSPARRQVLRDWLSHRGVTIKREKEAAPIERALEPIAKTIGGRYQRSKLVLDALKRGNTEATAQCVNLREQDPAVVTTSVQLAKQLHDLALIEAYKYHRAPAYQLHLTPSRLPAAINFVVGGWLELYVRTVLHKVIRETRPDATFSTLENPQVTLPSGEDFELDLLLEVDGEVWWIEMKSGGFQRHIAKYNRISKLLGLRPERSFMVLCDASVEQCEALSTVFAMTVVAVGDTEAKLTLSLLPRR